MSGEHSQKGDAAVATSCCCLCTLPFPKPHPQSYRMGAMAMLPENEQLCQRSDLSL